MKLRNINFIMLSLMAAMTLVSCEKDNYEEPKAGIAGHIYDQDGNPLQVSVGQGSMSIRIIETSFSHGDESIVVTPQYLNMKQDGTYRNDKLFAGTYAVVPWQGAFYENDEVDEIGRTVDLRDGTVTEVNFTVTPYLRLEWVKKPYVDPADGKMKASFRFFRNAKEGYAMPELGDCCMWISRTQFCGTEGDGNYTPGLTKITPEMEGTEIMLESKIAVKYDMKYWVRIGARCKDTYQKYNFTDIAEIEY